MKMKEITALILALCLFVIFVGCEKESGEITNDYKEDTTVAEEENNAAFEDIEQEVAPRNLHSEEVVKDKAETSSQGILENDNVSSQIKINVQEKTKAQSDVNKDTQVNEKTDYNMPSESTVTETTKKANTISFKETSCSFDKDKVAKAVELGFSSPFGENSTIAYTPNDSDVIKFEVNTSGENLYNSITHSGFTGLEIRYNRFQYQWDDFFGELDYTEYERNMDVSLKGESIFEADIVDDFEKYYRYYDENEGIYYEVTEMMMGNYTDDKEDLTKKIIGNCCYYKGIDQLIAPTYNPFILEKDEVVNNCYITSLDATPVIYLETTRGEKLFKKWVSIQYGVVVKQLIFESDGLISDSKVATNIIPKAIDDTVFIKPSDVAFKDITLFIYSLEGGNLEPLKNTLNNLLPKSEFSMTLNDSLGNKLIIHAGGYDEDMLLDKAIIISKTEDLNGEELTLRSYSDGDYYITVCDELKTAEKYESSCFEKKFFDFERTGFIGVEEDENTISFTFQNIGKGSVSGLLEFYEYVVDKQSNTLSKIKIYNKETLNDSKIFGEVMEYEIVEFGDADETLFNIPEDYKIIDHGKNSHDDGEHMPFWYE